MAHDRFGFDGIVRGDIDCKILETVLEQCLNNVTIGRVHVCGVLMVSDTLDRGNHAKGVAGIFDRSGGVLSLG